MVERKRGKRDGAENRSFINSLSHGLSVLEAVAASETDVPLAVLVKRVNLGKANVWRLAHTLVRLGYLRQDPETRRFSPSPRVLDLGYAYFDRLDLRQIAAPFLQELSSRVREMVNLAILDGDELVFVDRIKTSQIVNINLHPGSRLPLYNTSLGRALICEMPPTWLRQYIVRLKSNPNASGYVEKGGKRLVKMLNEVRIHGYALSDDERVEGLRAVSSPIRDKTSKIVAAMDILVPSTRITMAQLTSTFLPEVVETASKISGALGFRDKQIKAAKSTHLAV